MLSMTSLRMLNPSFSSVISQPAGILGSGANTATPTGEWSDRLEDSCAGLVGKGCLLSNKHWAGTVHLRLRAPLHRGVSQADALARLEHGRRERPRRSRGVREDGRLAWLPVAV
jgi:hypothetical protein